MGVDAVSLGLAVMMALGCSSVSYTENEQKIDATEECQKLGSAPGFCYHRRAGLCPLGVITQIPKLERCLQPESGARRLMNYRKTLMLELTALAGACGKRRS